MNPTWLLMTAPLALALGGSLYLRRSPEKAKAAPVFWSFTALIAALSGTFWLRELHRCKYGWGICAWFGADYGRLAITAIAVLLFIVLETALLIGMLKNKRMQDYYSNCSLQPTVTPLRGAPAAELRR